MRAVLVLLSLLACLASPALAQSEDADRGFLQRMIEDNLSGAGRDVRITGFRGALSSRATLEQLTIADGKGIWITLRGVTLDWTRTALLRGRFEVNRLSAESIILDRLPEQEKRLSPELAEARPFALPDLPVSVNIGEVGTQDLVLGAPVLGEEIALALKGSLSLGAGEGAARIEAARRDGRGTLNLDASFVNQSRVLALDLLLEEAAGGIAATLLSLPERPALSLSVRGTAPLSDYAADIRLATDGTDRLTGAVTIRAEGPPEAPDSRFTADLGGDLTPLVAAEFRAFFGTESRLALRGVRRAGGALDIEDLALAASQVSLSGRLSLDAAGWPTRFDLTGALGDGTGPVRLPVSGPPVTISRAGIAARYDAARGDRWRAVVDLDGFERPDVGIARASLDARGALRRAPPRGVTALAEVDLEGLRLADPALAEAAGTMLSGHATLEWSEERPLRLRGLQLSSGGARLSGEGEIAALSEGFPVSGRVTIEAPDLTRFAALAGQEMAGAARATLAGSGRLLGGEFDVTLDAATDGLALGIAPLDPLISSPGRLSLAAVRTTSGTDLERFSIENESLRATASGRLNSQSGALTLAASLSDLALADGRLSGPAEGSTNLSWTAGGDLALTGLDARLMGARIQATGRIAPEAEGLPASGTLRAAFEDLSRFDALTGRSLRGRLDLALDGRAEGRGQSFALGASLDGSDLATGIADLDRLIGGSLKFETQATRDPERIAIERLTLETPRLSLSARSDIPGAPLSVSARLADLGLFAPDFPGAVTATGRVTLAGPDAGRIGVDLAAEGPGGTTARILGDVLEHGRRLDLGASGNLPLALANGLIRPNVIQGTAQYDLRLGGPPALSGISGRITTRGTRVALPGTGLDVEDLSGTVTLAQGRAQTDLAARMGAGGNLRISGPVSLTPELGADLSLGLNDVVLTDRLIFRTVADGSVSIKGPLTGGALIGGAISLGQTDIRIPSGLGPASVSLPDLRHVNEPPEVFATRERAGLVAKQTATRSRPYRLDLFIDASRRIFVRGRGVDAELGGRLHIRGTSDAAAPDGFFELLRGRIDVLGRRLDLTEGRVTMQGSLDPFLRFVGETEADDVDIRLVLEGLASAPEVRFESDPFLPEDEVVARLIFGRGLDTISPLQAAQLAAAVATLSGGTDTGAAGRLRGAFGLSNLDVTETADGETSVSAGAYISEKIYTEVTADGAGRQKINLNLDMTRDITVRGSAANDGSSGIGIFFEKDY